MAFENEAPASLTTGYEHLMQSQADAALLDLSGKTIAFDANALLEFYRRHFAKSENIMRDLKRVRGQLFLPAQAQREFWVNRDAVLQLVRRSSSTREVAEAEKAAKKAVDAAARWDIDSTEQSRLKGMVDATFKEVRNATAGKSIARRTAEALSDPGRDVILQTLTELFAGQTGRPLPAEEMERISAAAPDRFARKQPPGYMDAEKPNGGHGDLILWMQLIRRAESTGLPVVLVTNDKKEDWWRLFDDGTPINARFELVEEMRDAAGVDFYTLTFDDFVNSLAQDPGSNIEESAVDDDGSSVEGVEDMRDPEYWTVEEFNSFVLRLIEWGYDRQAKVVLKATEQPDGVLARPQVLQILGMRPDAKLTGFTRGIHRVQESLIEDGVIRDELQWALIAQYDGPGKAQRFAVPQEVAEKWVPTSEASIAEAELLVSGSAPPVARAGRG